MQMEIAHTLQLQNIIFYKYLYLYLYAMTWRWLASCVYYLLELR